MHSSSQRFCVAGVPLLLFLIVNLCASCQPGPLRIAVLMPPPPGDGQRPALTMALDSVNAAGGIAGRRLEVKQVPYAGLDSQALQELAESVAADDSYVAAIGPGTSADLIAIADTFVSHKKPLVSFTSTSAEVLRAYGGGGYIWRTRQSDIAQAELLVRFAKSQGAQRPALLTSAAADGYTFFSWFGFFAQDLGYTEDAIKIQLLDGGTTSCSSAVGAAISAGADMVFLASGLVTDIECVVRGVGSLASKPRLVIADTGLDFPEILKRLGSIASGVEGISVIAGGTPSFDDVFRARYGTTEILPPHGASEHDALLLLAYGLAASGGKGGEALVQGMKTAVDGRQGSYGWDAAGVAAALAALGSGAGPDIAGATGPLTYEPQLYTDLASSLLAHWVQRGSQRVLMERYDTSSADFLTAKGALVRGGSTSAMNLSGSGTGFTPTKARTDLWAVIGALSSGWSNYRHQADALRQYQILRKNGVLDDHIVLILADDLATSASNPLPGVVRNEIDGPDLRAGAQIDYKLPLSPTQLTDIIAGRASAETPVVVSATDSSNLYVYLVGHGGQSGMPIGASTTSEGVSGSASKDFSPQKLRQTLCEMRTAMKLRRGLVILESCFSGAFGVSTYSGLDGGCDGLGGSPLDGVVLITAANSTEVSFAAVYDGTVRAWLADQFSVTTARFIESSPSASVSDLYQAVYVGVPGSHASIYNSRYAGQVSTLSLAEFFRP